MRQHDAGLDRPTDPDFDARMRALHRESLDRLSPATRQRLRSARTEQAPRSGRLGWALSTVAAVAVAAIALQLQVAPPTKPGPGPVVSRVAGAAAPAVAGEPLAMLDESPDLYLWLASADAASDPRNP